MHSIQIQMQTWDYFGGFDPLGVQPVFLLKDLAITAFLHGFCAVGEKSVMALAQELLFGGYDRLPTIVGNGLAS